MEEFKAKRHAVKKMTRKGLVETDSREGIVKKTAEAKSDGRRINAYCMNRCTPFRKYRTTASR